MKIQKYIALFGVLLIFTDISSTAQTPTATQAGGVPSGEQRPPEKTEIILPTDSISEVRLNSAGYLTFRVDEKTYRYQPWPASLGKDGYQVLLSLVGEIRQSSALQVQVAPDVNGVTPIVSLELRYLRHRIK